MSELESGLIIRFDGLDADNHKLDLFTLGESFQGIARIASVSGHFALTQKYSKYFSSHELRVIAKEPKANCYTIETIWEFVKQHQILSGSFGTVGAIVVNWILTSNANKAEEMKLLKDSLDKAIHALGHRDEDTIKGLLNIVDKMATELRSSARQTVAPLGKSANLLTVSSADGKISETYTLKDAEEIRKIGVNELSGTQSVVVLISELDTLRGTCKVHINGEQGEHRVPAIISDPLLQIPNNPYALSLAASEKIAVKAKLQLSDGEISKLYILDTDA